MEVYTAHLKIHQTKHNENKSKIQKYLTFANWLLFTSANHSTKLEWRRKKKIFFFRFFLSLTKFNGIVCAMHSRIPYEFLRE